MVDNVIIGKLILGLCRIEFKSNRSIEIYIPYKQRRGYVLNCNQKYIKVFRRELKKRELLSITVKMPGSGAGSLQLILTLICGAFNRNFRSVAVFRRCQRISRDFTECSKRKVVCSIPCPHGWVSHGLSMNFPNVIRHLPKIEYSFCRVGLFPAG